MHNQSLPKLTVNVLSAIPRPSERRVALRVTPAAQRAVRNGHPWLFDRAIRSQSHDGAPGDLAVIFDDKRRFLGVGLFDPTSPLRVRILQHGEPAIINGDWLLTRIKTALARRADLPASDTTGFRLLHGENDGLPGLVVDRYGDTIVIKLYTAAWVPQLHALLPALWEALPAAWRERAVLRLSRAVAEQRAHLYGLRDGQMLAGALPEGVARFRENGLLFEVEPVRGQKTGFFLDQRDNRQRVGDRVARDHGGGRVLNVFAYSGGFSLYAARGGAAEVVSLDVSKPALASAERNFALNEDNAQVAAAHHVTLAADAFAALAAMRTERPFDLVVLDPPAFAQKQSDIARALAAYARLTALGLGVLARGGTLVAASCSSRVPADDFFATVQRTAREAGRVLCAVERTGHAVDHPIGFPEGAYLKCLFARAD